jgi:hypothetical protein
VRQWTWVRHCTLHERRVALGRRAVHVGTVFEESDYHIQMSFLLHSRMQGSDACSTRSSRVTRASRATPSRAPPLLRAPNASNRKLAEGGRRRQWRKHGTRGRLRAGKRTCVVAVTGIGVARVVAAVGALVLVVLYHLAALQ